MGDLLDAKREGHRSSPMDEIFHAPKVLYALDDSVRESSILTDPCMANQGTDAPGTSEDHCVAHTLMGDAMSQAITARLRLLITRQEELVQLLAQLLESDHLVKRIGDLGASKKKVNLRDVHTASRLTKEGAIGV